MIDIILGILQLILLFLICWLQNIQGRKIEKLQDENKKLKDQVGK